MRIIILHCLTCSVIFSPLTVFAQESPSQCKEQYKEYAYSFYSILKWMYELKYSIDYSTPTYKLLCDDPEKMHNLDVFKQKTDIEIAQGLKAFQYLMNNPPREILDACATPETIRVNISKEIIDGLEQKRLSKLRYRNDIYQSLQQDENAKQRYTKEICTQPLPYVPDSSVWARFEPHQNYLYTFSKGHSALVISPKWDKEKSFKKFEAALKMGND